MSTVSVVATTVRTAVGLTSASTAAAVRAGVSRVQEHERFVAIDGDPLCAAFDSKIDERLKSWRRLLALLELPLATIVARLPWLADPQTRCHVFLALPEERPGFSSADARSVLVELQRLCPNWTVVPGGVGHAAALQSIASAAELVRAGHHHACIVGGVDSYLHGATLEWLQSQRRLRVANVRAGFLPGEAAGFVVLAGEHVRRSTNTPALARVAGCGSEVEMSARHSVLPNAARAVSASIDQAVAPWVERGVLVDAVYGDVNGERYRDDEWCTAQLRMHSIARYAPGRPIMYTSPARSIGDVGAATGVVLASLACEAWRRGYAYGPASLLLGASDYGLRSAVALEVPKR